jgi:subtilisin-like proprotein convertase family protein
MVVTMTRVNGVYERELAVTMELVPNNDILIFITTDAFSNTNANSLIGESQSVITAAIGTDNFDIGHTVSTGGGGLAGLGVICNSGNKARGITGSPAPVGDAYDIDYVAHEMGHQFGGSHTFNGLSGSCDGNQEPAYAVEPGGGTTIMAYAGLCVSGNIQSNSNDYFHTVSLDQIAVVLRNTSCAVETEINNTAPTIPTIASRSIPYGTAFILKSSDLDITDAEGDSLTYTWEQTNANGTNINQPTATGTNGPNFRSLPPSTERDRYMPTLANVLAGNLTPTWEVIPSVVRTLNFALTARDNNVAGGQTTRRNAIVFVRNAGPFRVTSQAEEGITWAPGTTQNITWDVAGTTANSINTATVNILLSTDSGLTFNTVLAAATDNDGAETITVPNLLSGNCRIKIEAVDNIYYAVNSTNFAVGVSVSNECNTFTSTPAIAIPDNNPTFTTSTVAVDSVDNITSVTVNVNITHTGVGDLVVKATSPTGTEVVLWQQRCTTNDDLIINFSDNGTTAACATTEFGNTYRPSSPLSAFIGQSAIGNWTLSVADLAAANTGTLNSWSVTVCGQVYTAATAQYNLKDFTLYPNPNNGSFTVQFTPDSKDATSITVHDMRGREVFKNNYSGTGLFNNNISLQNAQSGIYLVTVQNGGRKEVRKVVIK